MEKIFKIRSALIGPATGALAMIPLACSSTVHAAPILDDSNAHGAPVSSTAPVGPRPAGFPFQWCNDFQLCSLICPMLTTVDGSYVLFDDTEYYSPPVPTVAVGEQINFGWDCDRGRFGCPNNSGVPVLWELQGGPTGGSAYRASIESNVTAGMIGGYQPQRVGADCVCLESGNQCLKPVKARTTPSFSATYTMNILGDPPNKITTNNNAIEPDLGYSIPFQISVVSPLNAALGIAGTNGPTISFDSDGFPSLSLGELSPSANVLDPNVRTAGIYFQAYGQDPPSYAGQWRFVQLINSSNVYFYRGVNDLTPDPSVTFSYSNILDGGYPYPIGLPNNTLPKITYDWPAQKLPTDVDPLQPSKLSFYNKVEFIGNYTMTLMWRPYSKLSQIQGGWVPIPSDQATWIPVGAVTWSWDGVATRYYTSTAPGPNCDGFWCATGVGPTYSCASGACSLPPALGAITNMSQAVYPTWPTARPVPGFTLPCAQDS